MYNCPYCLADIYCGINCRYPPLTPFVCEYNTMLSSKLVQKAMLLSRELCYRPDIYCGINCRYPPLTPFVCEYNNNIVNLKVQIGKNGHFQNCISPSLRFYSFEDTLFLCFCFLFLCHYSLHMLYFECVIHFLGSLVYTKFHNLHSFVSDSTMK